MRGEAIHPGYAHSSYQTDAPITASIKHNIFISKSHIQQHKAENDFKTRMHSSRMRTGRSLTVCWRLLPGGVCLVRGRGGVPGPGEGWCAWSEGGVVYLVQGGGVPGLGGSGIPACTEAETPPALVPGPGGGGGVPGPGGGLASQHALRQKLPHPLWIE